MKNLKTPKGITLVALVITIIILLILAEISISALTNQGLFIQAQNAKNLTDEKTAEENAILTNYLEQMNAIIGGQATESVPDGAVATPINDITTLLKTAGISKQYSYTTIEQVIADSTCTESLMKNENAMKYLARSTEFADAICANENAMTYLGQSAYVDETALNNDEWSTKICNSTYFEKVLNVSVPTMTSNIAPSGEVFAIGYIEDCYPFKVFNGTHTNFRDVWCSNDGFPSYIGYKFTSKVCVRFMSFRNRNKLGDSITNVSSPKDFKIQASNNGDTWIDIGSYVNKNFDSDAETYYYINNNMGYQYYRLYILSKNVDYSGYSNQAILSNLQFYGRYQQ